MPLHFSVLFSSPLAVPIATFVLGPTSPKHTQFYKGLDQDGGELCPNITCLGQRCIIMYLNAIHCGCQPSCLQVRALEVVGFGVRLTGFMCEIQVYGENNLAVIMERTERMSVCDQ